MRQSACLVFNPIMVDNYAAFFFLHADGPNLKLFILVGWGRSFLSVALPSGVQLFFFFFFFFFCFFFFFAATDCKLFGAQGSPSSGSLVNL